MYEAIAVTALNQIEENKRFNEMCDNMSEEDARAARKSRSERIALESQRYHEIKVAEASKPDSGGAALGLGVLLGIGIS